MTTKAYELPVLLDLCGGSMAAMRAVLPLYVLKADGLWLDREAIAGALALDGDHDLIYGPSPDSELIDVLWARAVSDGLTWHPWGNLNHPALKVPFKACELAAFMLAGGGLSLFQRFDDAPVYSDPDAPKSTNPSRPGHFRISPDYLSKYQERHGPRPGAVVLDSHANEAREVMHEAMRLRLLADDKFADDKFGRTDEGVRKSAYWLLNDAHREVMAELQQAPTNDAFDASLLATRAQLIAAFGTFTGMDATWFKNLKDVPALRDARMVLGRGQRGQSVEPLFCPMAVMTWLMDPGRKKGHKFHSAGKPWELLERHFPRVYIKHSVGDPRSD